MHCDQVRTLLDRYLCDELAPDEQLSFEAHWGTCRDCQQQYADFRRLVDTLRSEQAPPVPADFVARLMVRAEHEAGSSSPFFPVLRTRPFRWIEANTAYLANAVAAVAAGLLIGVVFGQQTWERHSAGADRPTAYRDAGMIDSLNSFSGYSGKTMTQTYLSLTDAGNAQEI